MGWKRPRSIAIVGDGPAGATLGTLLARRGLPVVLFSRGRPAGPVVGESTIPAVVPILRELGIEREVAGYAEYKPGATFVVDAGFEFEIDFATVCRRAPGYAYNVPRDRFDATLLECCKRSGARVVEGSAKLERVGGGDDASVRLAPESREQARAVLGHEPDFLVDASGRSRLLARTLGLAERRGPRRDDALFAHWSGVPLDRTGHVHTDRLERGWCWRIPLPGRVSLGIVGDAETLRAGGDDVESRYRAATQREPHLRRLVANAQRLTPVVRYSNYQLRTLRGVGPGWALAGDSFGFVDPVFSSGLFLAMDAGRALAQAIVAGSARALRRYERGQLRHIAAWQQAADYFYDGRFFAIFRMGQREEARTAWIRPHVSRHLPGVFTGETTKDFYAPRLLGLMARRALSENPEAMRVA
ncbi:MAG: NAD(P)/FAD-dependent oxidoreductase [Myxococcota bacterium]